MKKRWTIQVLMLVSLMAASMVIAVGQSQIQNNPTPVRTNEINGTIKARDIGDSRLTTYYYTFNGTQGDIFINIVTKNFNGDIDVFAVEGLKSLTKIVVYADSPDTETGRLVYLRKPEKLLLRIEGRSPNDDPATFRIKFAGSFLAVEGGPDNQVPEMPEVRADNESGVRVNSVGTIIEVIPKPKPTPRETVAKVEPREEPKKVEPEEQREEEVPEKKEPAKPRVLVSENIPAPKKPAEVKKPASKLPSRPERRKPQAEPTAKTPKPEKPEPPREPPPPNPLDNIRLVVIFKDGKKIERPMSEVVRFNVNKGVLTVVLKDGTLTRHSILDVEKVTIE